MPLALLPDRRSPSPPFQRWRFLAVTMSLLLHLPTPAAAETSLERMIFQELNVARTNPAAYIRHLEHYRAQFQGMTYRQTGTAQLVRTNEGTTAVDEAIQALKGQKPLKAVDWAEGLVKSGRELISAQAQSGETGHGRGKLTMERRILRHGTWTVAIGEAITYGPYVAERGRDVITQLIVDDGVPSRGHRKTIYDPDFRLAGVSCSPHPVFDTACVIDFAGGARKR